MDKNKDIFGAAIKAFYKENDQTDITVHSPDFDDDIIPIDYLFREFDEMPQIEQIALQSCEGKVLDVGCGAGSHALYLQNIKNLDVKAIDTSPGAIEIARERGVRNAFCEDFFKIEKQTYDCILMLMNGSGIIGTLDNLPQFFAQAKTLLNAGGKILLDSSDLIFLFDDDDVNTDSYYGELSYQLSYKGLNSDHFDWLFIGQELLIKKANEHGFDCRIIAQGENHDFLASLNVR
ncbi:class I SAM-dependent methyltransferase [Christiangramia sabulilitoris]|uniref:Class I SAM-dependent methyltransferase n=1 Tax=Christiangramia sabulilitoris TaxID=2583991 RepID=A0A550I377_9FLAO|nr:class I SAM-dependent methyltransferase [Christiangramia sabulilitoris]TRO65426.1 class I SAM-dependent methyltransferase [Christiangramia sabulilitoris]